MRYNKLMVKKEAVFVIAGLVILGLLVAGYFYFFKSEQNRGAESAVGATETISETVPEIVTNPAEEVPEVNPLDRANPFKYKNPLR